MKLNDLPIKPFIANNDTIFPVWDRGGLLSGRTTIGEIAEKVAELAYEKLQKKLKEGTICVKE